MDPLLIGVDIGTTNLKVGVFSKNGKVKKFASVPTPIQKDKSANLVEYNPEKLFRKVKKLISKTTKEFRTETSSKIKSIAVSGMGEAGVPIDQNGKPVYPAISWKDKRGKSQFKTIKNTIKPEKLKRITGVRPSHIYSLNKILWLKEQKNNLFSKMTKWLDMPSWINFKLTDKIAMDFSQATRTMALNIWKKDWSKEILDIAGINSNIFPKLKQAGTKLSELKKEHAQSINLPEDVKVSVGGHDHPCASLGSGAIKTNTPLNSVGTSEVFLISGDKKDISKISNSFSSTGCHVLPEKYYTFTANFSAGEMIDWFIDNFYEKANIEYSKIVKKASKVSRGSEGLMFIPPDEEKNTQAEFQGVTKKQGRSHFARAIIEGLVMKLKNNIKRYGEGVEDKVKKIRVVGGGAKNSLWNKIKSEALNTDLKVSQFQNYSSLGAALLGGVGANVFDSQKEAIRQIKSRTDTVSPNSEGAKFYRKLFNDKYRKYFNS